MALEDFNTEDNGSSTREKTVWHTPGGGKHNLVADEEKLRDAKREVIKLLKKNSSIKYIRNRDLSADSDLEEADITLVLDKIEAVERWSSENTANPMFLNPYYSE